MTVRTPSRTAHDPEASETTRNMPAAGGPDCNHRTQFLHLRTYLTFQRQTEFDETRIDWCTTINRHQSRDHITRALHAKINRKDPDFHQPGRLNTPEGQRELLDFRRHLVGRERLNHRHGGRLPWNLRYRMIHAHHRRMSEANFHGYMFGEDEGWVAIRPKLLGFPEHIQLEVAYRELLRDLLAGQGAKPRNHPDAIAVLAHDCGRCHNLIRQETPGRLSKCTTKLAEIIAAVPKHGGSRIGQYFTRKQKQNQQPKQTPTRVQDMRNITVHMGRNGPKVYVRETETPGTWELEWTGDTEQRYARRMLKAAENAVHRKPSPVFVHTGRTSKLTGLRTFPNTGKLGD